jgi:hypothetical protein
MACIVQVHLARSLQPYWQQPKQRKPPETITHQISAVSVFNLLNLRLKTNKSNSSQLALVSYFYINYPNLGFFAAKLII